MRRFFKPPIFEDEEKTKTALLLHLILYLLIPTMTLVGILTILALPQNTLRWLIFIFLGISSIVIAIFLNQGGKTRMAGTIFILVLWILVTVMALTAGGMQSPAINGFLVIVFIAGLVFGGSTGLATALLCSLTGLGMVLAQTNGILPPNVVNHTPISFWLIHTLFLGAVAGLQQIASHYMKDAALRVTRELKERRETEAALRESEERFRTIFNSVNDAIFIHDPLSGAVLDVNQKACEVYGYSREVLCSLSVSDISSDDPAFGQEIALEYIHKAAQGQPQVFEWKSKNSQGHEFWNEINIRQATIGKQERVLVTARDIDERKMADIELRESEERFRTIFEQAPEYCMIVDLEGNILDVNQQLCLELGFSRPEILGKNTIDLLSHRQIFAPQFWDRGIPENLQTFEISLINKVGLSIPIEARLCTINLGEQQRILAFGHDITQRKQAEQAAQLEERRLQSVVKISQYKTENLDDWMQVMLGEVVALSDSQFGAIFYYDDENDEFTRFFSLKSDIILQNDPSAGPVRFPLRLPEASIWHEPIRHNKPIRLNQISASDAQKFGIQGFRPAVIRFMAVPIWSEGHILAVIGVSNKLNEYTEADAHQLTLMMDIAWKIIERKEAETALQKSEERYRELVELSQDAVIVTDEHGFVKFANPAAQNLFGYSEQSMIGKDMRDTYPSVDYALYLEKQNGLSSGKYLRFEREAVRKDGSTVLVDATFTPLSKKEYQSIYRDITQQKQIEAELERRVAERTSQLASANKELESFSYSVSHDLKAPLRGIDGYSQLLEELYSKDLNEEGQFFIHTIRGATLQMAELIDDLLSYSRLERRVMTTIPIDLREFSRQILDAYQSEIDARGVQVQYDLPPLTVQADPEGLLIALRNIVDNALKFTRKIPNPVIKISSEEHEHSCVIWVYDNGIGFDTQYYDRIFEVFQRLQRVEDYPGTGVGLAIARKAMQRMGGRIWAESKPDEGATFFLEIPK